MLWQQVLPQHPTLTGLHPLMGTQVSVYRHGHEYSCQACWLDMRPKFETHNLCVYTRLIQKHKVHVLSL